MHHARRKMAGGSRYPEPSQFMPGQEVNLPWQRKGGRVENWKAIVVSEGDMKKKLSASYKQHTASRKQLQTAPKKLAPGKERFVSTG